MFATFRTASAAPRMYSSVMPSWMVKRMPVLQDGLDFGRLVLREVHRRQAHLAHGPVAGEEAVVLEHRLAMQRHADVAGAEQDALGRERLDELRRGRSGTPSARSA